MRTMQEEEVGGWHGEEVKKNKIKPQNAGMKKKIGTGETEKRLRDGRR